MSSKFEIGGIFWDTGKDNNSEIDRVRTGYIRVKPNTKYIISEKNLLLHSITHVFYLNKNKEFISLVQPPNGTPKISFTTPSDCFYIRFLRMGQGTSTDIYIQLEEGTQATSYEPYQEDKLTILSPTPLEKVGDIADRIICKDGVYGVEKNIGELVIDGDSTIVYWIKGDTTVGVLCRDSSIINTSNLDKVNAYCNVLPSTIQRGFTSRDVEGVCVWDANNQIAVKVLKSKLSSEDTLGVKQWLQDNNAKIMYPLAEPTFIPLPRDQQVKLRTFANKTHIHFETEIEPTLKAQVPKSLGATVNSHTSQIDNLNKELDRVKKLEESTVSTVTSDKAFTTVAETSSGYFEDVKLEGKTLVNLFDEGNFDCEDFTLNGCRFSRTAKGYKYGKLLMPLDKLNLLKSKGKYKVIVNITKNTLVEEGGTQRAFEFPTFNYGGWAVENSNKGYYSLTFAIGEIGTKECIITMKDFENLSSPIDRCCLYFESSYYASSGELEGEILITEYDESLPQNLNFFEGLKSVGQGVDEISVLSCNKNLLDLTKLNSSIPNPTNIRIDYLDENNLKFTTLSTNTNKYASVYFDGFNFIPNVKHKFKCKVKYKDTTNTPFFSIRDHSNVSIQYVGINVKNGVIEGTFTPNHPNHRIEFFAGNHTGTLTNTWIEFTDIQLSLADSNFEYYTPVKEDKKQILYYNPTTQTWEKPVLREWDSIEKHSDGKYYYHKRSGEIVFNGSEHWHYPESQAGDNTVLFYSRIHDSKINQNYPICNMFSGTYLNIWESTIDIEGILINHNKDCILRLNKAKLPTQDVAGFKQWLQANPTTVVYELAQEEIYECTNLDLITYSGETNLIVNSGAIQPKITLKVLSNVSNVVKLLQEKVSVLENKFIEGLKQVLSGNMMALAHLLYPEDFEHEIQTLEL